MFEKGVCEEIITDDKLIIVLSNDIIDAYILALSNNIPVKIPKLYIDKTSNNHDLFNFKYKYVIRRLHDCIENQTFYIISLLGKNIPSYDTDFIQFIHDASKDPKYKYDIYVTNNIYQKRIFTNVPKSRFIQFAEEVIFTIDLNGHSISKEYQMERDYRSDLNLIDIVSLLSDYREELNTIDQEG